MTRPPADLATLWPAAIALVAALALASLAPSHGMAPRLSNLDLRNPEIPDTYLVESRFRPERCSVVGRRGATFHRGETARASDRWECRSVRQADGAPLWLLRSKRRGEGTALLLPAAAVPDWTFPFFYDFVRERDLAADLPFVGWTQLFVSRVYQGLYLRVSLPFDLRKRDGGPRTRRRLLVFQGGRVGAVDTRFEGVAVPGGPEGLSVEPASALLRWLARLRPSGEEVFLRADASSGALRPLPLPVSLQGVWQRIHGAPLPGRALDAPAWPERGDGAGNGETEPVFAAREEAALRYEFRIHAQALWRALRVDAQLRGAPLPAPEALRRRQGAALELDLALPVGSVGSVEPVASVEWPA